MRRTATTTLATLLAVLCTAIAVISWATPASAVKQPKLTIAQGKPVKWTREGRLQELPQTVATAPTPDQCETALHCDWIPFRIEIPSGLGKGDDYYVDVVLNWPDDDFSNLDMWLWDNKQTKAATGKKNPGDPGYGPADATSGDWTQIINATGDMKPARMRIVEPRLGDYNLTVLNYSDSGNYQYTIEATVVVEKYEEPVESKEDDPVSTTDDEEFDEDDFVTTDDGTTFGTVGGSASSSDPFGLGSIAIGCDPLLCGISDTDLGETLAAPPFASTRPDALNAAAKPPGAGVLVLWLVALPVGIAAGGAALLRRRRRSAFAI